MKEFLEVGKDLQIMEIKDVPEEENTIMQGYVNETNQDISAEDESSDDIDSVDKTKNGISQLSVPSNSTKCP